MTRPGAIIFGPATTPPGRATAIKDDELAAEFAAVEREPDLDPRASRGRIKEAIDRRYTGPASAGTLP